MPTAFSHAAVGFVAARVSGEIGAPNVPVVVASMALSALPDVDALFIRVIPYGHPFGHRGFTHSLFFAAIVGLLVALGFRKCGWSKQYSYWSLAALFALVTASHGFFDAMTDGGLGVAFFAPFTNRRFFFPWRPIPVAPLSFTGLLTARGLLILRVEAMLFGPFTLAAAVWNPSVGWRRLLAAALAVIGIIAWIRALM